MSFINKIIYFFFLFFFPITIIGQDFPPVENYLNTDYGGENQNWAISQCDEGYMYIANNAGLLEYNGARWSLYPSPNKTILRYVNVIDGKIYTGGYMEFGYWERNEFGKLEYTSISEKIKDKIIEEDFWKIIKFDKFILWAGIFPPDMNFDSGKEILKDKKVITVYGDQDPFITPERMEEMELRNSTW